MTRIMQWLLFTYSVQFLSSTQLLNTRTTVDSSRRERVMKEEMKGGREGGKEVENREGRKRERRKKGNMSKKAILGSHQIWTLRNSLI